MEIVLVRHAQPQWSRDRTAQVDPGLTRLGDEQAARVADRLAAESFDVVLVSTAVRARRTAEPIVAHHDSRPELREWLHELRMPRVWQGTPAEEVDRALSEARDRPREAWWDGMPGGETFKDFHARVTSGLRTELAEHGVTPVDDALWEVPPGAPRMLLVAHAGTNSAVLGDLLGLPPEPWEWERFSSNHASLTLLRAVPIAGHHIFSLQSFSDVGHLPPRLHTT